MTVVEHSTYELLRTFQLHIETKNCQFNRVFGKYQRNYLSHFPGVFVLKCVQSYDLSDVETISLFVFSHPE